MFIELYIMYNDKSSMNETYHFTMNNYILIKYYDNEKTIAISIYQNNKRAFKTTIREKQNQGKSYESVYSIIMNSLLRTNGRSSIQCLVRSLGFK